MSRRTTNSRDLRKEAFAKEVIELQGWEATVYDTEVAVSVVEDENKLNVDARELLQAGIRHGLVASEVKFGNNIGEFHFEPWEVLFVDANE